MIRRAGIASLAILVGAVIAVPAHAEPIAPPLEPQQGRFQQLDLARLKKLGVVGELPQSMRREKTVSALVELTTAPVAVQRTRQGRQFKRADATRRVRASQDSALPKLRAAGATSYGRLDTVLNAIQVRVRAGDLAKLAAVPGVKKVQVARTVTRDNAAGSKFTGVGQTWQDYGYTGKGQVVAVIDSGIDYTHADFGGAGTVAAFEANDSKVVEPGSFPTKKVTGGYDFVGDAYGSDQPDADIPQPDADPLDCEGHGTHVAGTAAGYGVTPSGATYTGPYKAATLDQKFKVEPGVAPLAALRAYRVFGCEGGVSDDIIIAAIDRAVRDGSTVINMSLGSDIGTANDVTDQAIRTATEAGVLVVTSAGNAGGGAYLVGGPSTSDQALSVAAVDAEFSSYPGVTVTGAVQTTGLVANGVAVTAPISGELVDVGLGCEAGDYAGVSGKIALTTRGVCDRVARAQFGQQAGAKAVIMINTDATLPPFEGPIEGVSIPFVGVGSGSGAAFRAADGEQVTLSATKVANPAYRHIADFSSNGPRFGDSAQKPDVAAPGVSVPSALSGSGSDYVRESGTSMSAPHTAGVAALVRQAHPSWSPLRAKALLMSTASASKISGFDSQAVGAGLVQPRRAVAAKAYASTTSGLNSLRFGFNHVAGKYTETRSFQIANRSSRSVTYKLSSTLSTPSYGADIKFSPKKVKVSAGQTKTINVTIALSKSDAAKLPGAASSTDGVVSSLHGLVVAQPTKSRAQTPKLVIPMMFVPAPLSNVKSAASVREVTPGVFSTIRATNAGVHTGTADVYTWLLADAAGDATDPTAADLTNVGVQSLPGTAAGAPASDRLLVFAAAEAKAVSTHSVQEVDIALDTDGDGDADFFTFSVDTGLFTAGAFDGTQTAFTIDADSGDLVDAWTAFAPSNGSTVLLPVLASSIGVTAASPPVQIGAAGFSVISAGSDAVDTSAFYDPFTPALGSGQSATLKPGASTNLAVTVDKAQLASQTSAGWLVISPDDRAGLAEADRVRLNLPAPAAAAARDLAKTGDGVTVTRR